MNRRSSHRILVTRFPFQSRWGGEEVHTMRLMTELDKKGHEVFFMGSDPVLLDAFKRRGFEVKQTKLYKAPVTKLSLVLFTIFSPFLFIKSFFDLRAVKKKWNIDTVYMLSFGEKLMMTWWAHKMGLRVLWLEHARIGNWLKKNPWRRLYTRLSKWSKTIVTSNAMLPIIDPFVVNARAISCGLMLSKSSPLRDEIKDFLSGGFAIGTVARLTVDKGVDKIVRLVHSKPDVRLIIVGDGPLINDIKAEGRDEQILVLPELPRTELMSLYAALDLFILGSMEMDPFGLVAIEAMAMGTPAMLTDQCGVASDLRHQENAYIVEPRFASLDKGLKTLMKRHGLRKKIAERGQSFVKDHYKLSDMVKAFESEFDAPIPAKKNA